MDINEAAAESLLETLHKKHGAEKALFVKCDVESEEQIKGQTHKTTVTYTGGTQKSRDF